MRNYMKRFFTMVGFTGLVVIYVIFFSDVMKVKKHVGATSGELLTDEKNHIYELNPNETFNEETCKEKLNEKFKNHNGENDEVRIFRESICQTCRQQNCPYHLAGKLYVNTMDVSMEDLVKEKMFYNVHNGGWYIPSNCKPIKSVAIVLPFRNRENHLPIFLRHMHPILQRQNLHYRIFVIDQVDEEKFNRGKLFNVGFVESLKIFPYDCVVFHDVDLLSEDDRNTFDCSTSPQHMCAFLDKFDYKLLYPELFGGVEMFTREHFQLINGFSNSFWGWGAEDDDLFNRLMLKNLSLWRTSPEKSRYRMIRHKEAVKDNTVEQRRDLRDEAKNYIQTDGLINLQYEIVNINIERLYTRIKVNLRKDRDKLFGVKDFPS